MATLALTTAVGSPFDIRRFAVRESVSSAFEIELVAMAEDPSIDLESVVGKPATFRMEHGYAHANVGGRSWTGIVSHVEQVHGLAAKAGSFQIRPIHPFADAPAKRVLIRATKTGKAPLRLMPPLVLHDRAGAKHTGLTEAILRGEAGLAWD